jgi:hypothetical protein
VRLTSERAYRKSKFRHEGADKAPPTRGRERWNFQGQGASRRPRAAGVASANRGEGRESRPYARAGRRRGKGTMEQQKVVGNGDGFILEVRTPASSLIQDSSSTTLGRSRGLGGELREQATPVS